MKCVYSLLFLTVLCFTTVLSQRPGEGDYSRILSNGNYVQKQINCVLDTAGCDNVGRQLKAAIPEILGRRCQRCTARQLENSRRVINYIRVNYPESWTQIERKYGRALI